MKWVTDDPSRIHVVASQKFANDIYLQLRPLGFKKEQLIIEPAQKNTAPAIALAAKVIHQLDRHAKILVAPSDHLIDTNRMVAMDISRALTKAGKKIVVFGITPTHPSPEYGYISPKKAFTDHEEDQLIQVERFVEKPNKEIAEQYIQKGYLWNAGIFLFDVPHLLKEIKEHLPSLDQVLVQHGTHQFDDAYRDVESISIDNGLLEKTKHIVVAKARFRWRDIGSWKVLYELSERDERGNVMNEHALQLDCNNSLIYGSAKRVAAVVAMEDVIVVDTEDALLVTKKSETHRTKEVYEMLKKQNRRQYLEHRTIYRPWGSYTVLEDSDHYKVKKIVVDPRAKLSLQSHAYRTEHWVVTSGKAKATINGKVSMLEVGESIGVPLGAKHRLENPIQQPLEIIEVQQGEYLGEDDIVRYDDKYKRL